MKSRDKPNITRSVRTQKLSGDQGENNISSNGMDGMAE